VNADAIGGERLIVKTGGDGPAVALRHRGGVVDRDDRFDKSS